MPVTGSKVSALAVVTPASADHLYIVQGGNSRKVLMSALQTYASAGVTDHLAEVDPVVHSASKVSYDGTVPGAADVQAAIDAIHLELADPAAFTAAVDLLSNRMSSAESLLGGNLFSGAASILGIGTRALWDDDFFTHQDGENTSPLTSGKIGEKGWLKTGVGVVSPVASPAASRPGVIRLDTGAASPTLLPVYSPISFVPANSFFEMHAWFRVIDTGTNVAYRIGLSETPTNELPANGIFFEKQAADTVWHITNWNAGTVTRVATAVAPAANTWIHVRLRRTTLSDVAVDYNIAVAGVPGPWSLVTLIPFAPANVLMAPFMHCKTITTTAMRMEVDRVSVLLTELNR